VTVAATKKGNNNMNPFETWLQATICEPMGMNLEDLSDEQKVKAKVRFEAQAIPKKEEPKKEPLSSDPNLDRIKAQNELEATNMERIDRITEIAASYVGVTMNETYIKDELKLKGKTVAVIKGAAIREKWSADKFELACTRAEREDIGKFAIHSS
ncbi:unnamed protein product, partial [marine sediment metagenome]